ncbi:MAG: DUF4838 domain-containing protein [Planctomycetota bacterium]|jgi:hypothetical protein
MGHPRAFAVGLILWAAGRIGFGVEAIRVVDDGRPRATVVVAAGSDDQTKRAAELLVDYVERATGATLPMVEAIGPTERSLPAVIHVGRCPYADALDLDLDDLDDDGFVIRGVDAEHLVVVGPTPWGTEFGVCEFLERYVGVRWLMPGPHGDDVPSSKNIHIPVETIRQQPAFFSRLFSGLQGEAQTTWARRNRMHGRVLFHHNLHRLFPPLTYTKTHPHFFPVKNGGRYFPPTNDTHGWQPCFTAEGIVDEAIHNICRYFDEHPEATSYSLGVVDSSGHCQCEACQAEDSGEENFLGRRDVSDRYFAWCNRVVEGVLEKHPDKLFGCLAYSEVAQPPSRVSVHPRIIPYMTYDRMKWVHPRLRAEGERITRWWHKMSPTVGWYDYVYGWTYCLPRVWFHHMADYYRFGYAHGVRALYAEAYPNWGEGPKLYVSLKLQWDPRQDVDELLRDWYVRAVGREAADDLAAYFALWEDFWTRRILQSEWFTESGQYLRFSDPSYLADVTDDDLTKSRTLLERVVAKAETPAQKARAELLLLAFDYYEASAVAYGGNRLAEQLVVRSEADALGALDRGERCLEMAAKRQRIALEVFPKHPYLLRQIDFDRRPQLRGDDWGAGILWRALDWVGQSDAVRRRVGELAGSPLPAVSLQAKTMLVVADESSPPLSANPSFEDPNGKWPGSWSTWVKWGIGTKTVSPAAARTGKQGVLCRGMKRGGPHQTVEVTPGRYAATACVRVPQPPKSGATITLSITPLDQNGQNLPSLSSTLEAKAGDWTRMAACGEIPARLAGHEVKRVRLIVVVDGFEPNEEVHIDDVALYRIP